MTAPTIIVYPADTGGVGNYRIIWPAEALRAQGADLQIVYDGDNDAQQINGVFWNQDDGARIRLATEAPDCDVAVIQRPLTEILAESIPVMQRRGVKVVVEIDDDFENISPRNISWGATRPPSRNETIPESLPPQQRAEIRQQQINRQRRNHLHLRRSCELADLVVVSTPALASVYGRHGRVAVVPNCVPEWYQWATPLEPWEGVRVGWTGSLQTHPDDLQVTKGGVQRALRATGAQFTVVGTGTGVQRALGLASPPLACGWQPLDRYPSMMAAMNVGIVPLEQSRFNEAKSWLKGLEFAALGVPFVASPTGPYVELLARGAGLVAERPKDWERLLKRLIANADDRAELAEAGREVARGLTIEGNCGRWWDAWSSVVNTRAASSVA